jgi:hypothetical protein
VLEEIKRAIKDRRVNITEHADEEMADDGISQDQLFRAIVRGEIIEDYPKDFPFPSCLILGFDESERPIHAVVAFTPDQEIAIIVTSYVPDPARWVDFKRRRTRDVRD